MALPPTRGTSAILKKHGYIELKKIGEGSFGKAVLVQTSDGARLVCKMIDISKASPKETQDTVKEARLLASFKHPFIVEYTTNFTDGGWLCIMMTYCEGGDLTTQVEQARRERRRILEDQVLRWMAQALLALKYIHDRRVLHRDLKSSNFFLTRRRNLKMGDFGIARVLQNTQACARTIIGTPQYLSPEVCLEKAYTWPSDIWSMGCILYELCALKFPFDGGQSIVVLVQSITRGTTPALPEGYSDFSRQLCNDMLNKNPSCRPTAGAILDRSPIQAIVKQFVEEAKALDEAAKKEPDAPTSEAQPGEDYQNGDAVEYYSDTHKTWIPAVITNVDADGRVTVDVKPNAWIPREKQVQLVRPRSSSLEADPEPEHKAKTACSTQELERLLGEESLLEPDRSKYDKNDGIAKQSEARSSEAAGHVGIAMAAHGGDDEYFKLLEDLELSEASGGAEAPWPAPEDKPDMMASLSAAELDLLHGSV